MTLSKYILLCLTLFHCAGMAQAQGSRGTSIDKIIAKVDNYTLLRSDLETAYLQFKANEQRVAPDAKCRILENLVINKVMVAKAEIDSVIVEDKLVESNLDRRMQYFISQFGTAERIEKAYGKTIDELKTDLRKQVKEQLTVQKMQEEITKDLKMTPNEVRKFYNNIPKDSIPFFSTEVEVGQIVKVATINKSQKQATRAKLNELRTRIVAGEKFEDLARTYSEDPGSAEKGGELGMVTRGMMVPEFEAVALKLKPGELSGVLESEYGFHIIQLIERKGNEYNARHILLRPDYSSVDISMATNYLDSLRNVILKDSISFEKAAKEYSDDKETASSGGLLLDQNSGSTKIFSENLDPTIFFVVDTMQVGRVSQAVPYRTENGKSAVRLLYYKSKTTPHQANLKDDWEKIQTAALADKKNRKLTDWFNKAKSELYIRIDDEYSGCKVLESGQ